MDSTHPLAPSAMGGGTKIDSSAQGGGTESSTDSNSSKESNSNSSLDSTQNPANSTSQHSSLTAQDKQYDTLEAKQLQKVSVTVSSASGSEKNIVTAPASVTVITKEELEQKPYRDLGEALKEVPGVSLESTSNKLGASAISIRGMPAGYTLYLLDDFATKSKR